MKKVLLIAIAMMTTLVTASAQNGTGCTKQQADNMVLNTLLVSDLASSDEASLVITNAMGIEVANILLEGNRGSKVIDLTKAVSGVYGCYIQCGTFIKKEKIIVK